MKYKICIIYDIHIDTPRGRLLWAYGRRSSGIAANAPPDFEVEQFRLADFPWERADEWDCILNLEYSCPVTDRIRKHSCDVPVIFSFNSDGQRKRALWPMVRRQSNWIIFNSMAGYEAYGPAPRTCCISNGIDHTLWYPSVPIEQRPHRVLWTGSSNPQKGKGYQEILLPLAEDAKMLGFEIDFRPIDEVNAQTTLTTAEMHQWYNSGSYIVCASRSEGTPNTSLEGAACGCVLVTTKVGNALEWGRDGENMVFSERNKEAFLEALLLARDNRERLSVAGAAEMREHWSYGAPGNRALHYFNLFRQIITDDARDLKPFSYLDVPVGVSE